MNWTAIVPLKPPGNRKSRLAAVLNIDERQRLSEKLFDHVIDTLAGIVGIEINILATVPPKNWPALWRAEQAGGLNAAITAARKDIGAGPFAIFHADLPLLTTDDVLALLDAAEVKGCAIAPDHHGSGTNALAIADGRPFRFAFGQDSFPAHYEQGGAVVRRTGLAHDVDTPEDLASARALGALI